MSEVLNWLVRAMTDSETQMVAVERVNYFTELTKEAPPIIPSNRPPGKNRRLSPVLFDN